MARARAQRRRARARGRARCCLTFGAYRVLGEGADAAAAAAAAADARPTARARRCPTRRGRSTSRRSARDGPPARRDRGGGVAPFRAGRSRLCPGAELTRASKKARPPASAAAPAAPTLSLAVLRAPSGRVFLARRLASGARGRGHVPARHGRRPRGERRARPALAAARARRARARRRPRAHGQSCPLAGSGSSTSRVAGGRARGPTFDPFCGSGQLLLAAATVRRLGARRRARGRRRTTRPRRRGARGRRHVRAAEADDRGCASPTAASRRAR